MKKASKTNYFRTHKKVFILGIGLILVASGWYFISAINNTGLVLHYTFDNDSISGTTIYDQSGRGNHGTITIGSGATGTVGVSGEAMEFDGSASYIDIATSTLAGMESEGTIAMWVKAEWSAIDGLYARVIGSGHSAGINSQFRTQATPRLDLTMGYGGGVVSARAFPANDIGDYDDIWVYIHYMWYESGGSYYVQAGHNGQWLYTSIAAPNAFVMPDTLLQIGNWSSYYFPGQIDEVRIYNRALSEDEIQNIYNNTATKYQVQTPNKSGLVGYWNFDSNDTYQNTVYDKSGYGNDVTIINDATTTTGKIGEAMEFDGIDDYVQNTTTVDINLQDDATILVWAYYDGVYDDGVAHFILEVNDVANNNRAVLYKSGAVGFPIWYAYWKGDGTEERASTRDSSKANKWTLFGLRKSGSNLSLILDGQIVDTQSDTTINHNANCTELTVGADDFGNDNWPGSIDEVRIYDRALSEDEILNLYQSTGKKFKVHSPNKTGLVGYWNFDSNDIYQNTVYDKSGYGNNGTIYNGATTTTGKVGEAMSFDGIDDYVDCGNDSSLDITDEITVSAWVKPSVAQSNKHIVDKLALSGNGGWRLTIGDTAHFFWQVNNTETPWSPHIDSTHTYTAGNWYHVVGSYDRSNIRIYVNGVESNSTERTGDIDPSTVNVSIGSWKGTHNFINGSIDEVRIYNRALSPDEILNNYLYSQKTHINY